jgi:hypothetical protein
VVARHLHHSATLRGGRDAERVPVTLHDQHRHGHSVEFGETALARACASPARGPQRERQANDRDGPGRRRGAAGHPRTQRPTADDKRQSAQLNSNQTVDHSRPGGVELASRSWRPPPGDAVGLLDERDAHPFRTRDLRHGDQVG